MYSYFMKSRMTSHNLWQQLISPTLQGSLAFVCIEGAQNSYSLSVMCSWNP